MKLGPAICQLRVRVQRMRILRLFVFQSAKLYAVPQLNVRTRKIIVLVIDRACLRVRADTRVGGGIEILFLTVSGDVLVC